MEKKNDDQQKNMKKKQIYMSKMFAKFLEKSLLKYTLQPLLNHNNLFSYQN